MGRPQGKCEWRAFDGEKLFSLFYGVYFTMGCSSRIRL